jgi:hypothetical protein
MIGEFLACLFKQFHSGNCFSRKSAAHGFLCHAARIIVFSRPLQVRLTAILQHGGDHVFCHRRGKMRLQVFGIPARFVFVQSDSLRK